MTKRHMMNIINKYIILIFCLVIFQLLSGKVYNFDKEIALDFDSLPEDSLKIEKIRQSLFEDGYLDLKYEQNNDTVFFQVGTKSTIDSLHFVGHLHFSEKQLRSFKSTIDDKYTSFSKKNIDELIEQFLDFYEERGFPLCKINVGRIEKSGRGKVFLTLNIESEDHVKLSFLKFRGNVSSYESVLLRESRVVVPGAFNTEIFEDGEKYLYKSEMFERRPIGFLVKDTEGGYGLVYEVEEAKYNSIDGIVGYSTKKEEDGGGFKGKIDLGFENIFGTFRKGRISWFKKNSDEESISLFYQEPWLYLFPLKTALKFEQNFVRDEYLERKYGVEFDYNLNLNFNLLSGYSRESIFPDSLLLDDGYRDTEKIKYSGGFRYATFFNRFKIEEGVALEVSAATIKKKIKDFKDFDDSDINASLVVVKHITGHLFLRESLDYGQVFSDSLEFYDKLKIGGINSVRGYDEDQFSTDVRFVINNELHFKIDDQTRIFGFYDAGVWSEADQTKDIDQLNFISAIGAGISYRHNLGEMEVNYAYPFEEGFESGKIHVRYINKF